MNNSVLSLPGYRLCEYQIVLHPHQELWNKIMDVKKDFAKKFEAPSAEWGKPQIALVKFTQLKLMEERIVNRLKMIAMSMPVFKVELKDFGTLPSHTVYINVDTKVAIQMLIKGLKSAQSLLRTKEQKAHFIEQAYIPVATRLLPWQYEKASIEYSHKHFSGRFMAADMLLLRRLEGQKSYQPVQKFEFMNMPVVTTQGKLFV
jgi:hypothetical protein